MSVVVVVVVDVVVCEYKECDHRKQGDGGYWVGQGRRSCKVRSGLVPGMTCTGSGGGGNGGTDWAYGNTVDYWCTDNCDWHNHQHPCFVPPLNIRNNEFITCERVFTSRSLIKRRVQMKRAAWKTRPVSGKHALFENVPPLFQSPVL